MRFGMLKKGCLLVVLLIVCSTLPAQLTAQAADMTPDEYLYYAYTSGGKKWSPAVIVGDEDSGFKAYTSYREDYVEKTDFYLSNGDGEQYSIRYDTDNGSIMLWELEGDTDGLNVLEPKKPVKEQSVTVAYLNSGKSAFLTTERTMASLVKLMSDGSGVVKLSEKIEDASDFPGVLFDDGKCVGILYADNKAFVEWFDQETFDSDGDSDKSDSEKSEDDTNWMLLIGIAGGVLALAILVFLLVRKSRNSRRDGGKTSKVRSETVKPSVKAERKQTGPQEPRPRSGRSASSGRGLFLACQGGYLDGRIYPIKKGVTTIGRADTCTIRYPAEYRGVSRVHAKIRLEDDRLLLTDTSSTGIYLERIQGRMAVNRPMELKAGDVFYFGNDQNRFEIVERT